MAQQTRTTLKTYFNTGDTPTEAQFIDLIDSSPNPTDDGTTGTGSYVRATSPTLVTPALGTPASGTLTNCTGLPLAGVVDSTTEALGVGSLEVGHASDTTVTRVSAGVIAVEGNNVLTTATGQPLDAQLTSLAALTYAGNGNKVVRVNAGETDFELAAAVGGGDVSKVGTPVNNQVGVWTGDGTLEGDAALTFDTTTDTLAVGGTIELGHASDTTLSRTGAGDIAVEGNAIYRAGGTDVPVTDGGTGASTAAAARVNLGVMNIVALTSAYTNTSAANTPEDVTGFLFPVVNGGTYYFRIVGVLSVTVATTGFRMIIDGPTTSYLGYRNIWPIGPTTQSINHGLTAYNLPASSSTATAATTGNVAVIEGVLTASADGDIQVRIASEIAGGGGLTIEPGSIIEYYRVS